MKFRSTIGGSLFNTRQLVVQQNVFGLIDLRSEKVITATIGVKFLDETSVRRDNFCFRCALSQTQCR